MLSVSAGTPSPFQAYAGLRFAGASHKVMTLNTDLFSDLDNPGKAKAIARIIRTENPEVIGLQEVGDRFFLEAFNKSFLNSEYPTIVTGVPKIKASAGTALIAKKGVRIISTTRHGPEGCSDGRRCPNPGALEVLYKTPRGYRLKAYVNHFKSPRGPYTKQALLDRPPKPGEKRFTSEEWTELKRKDEATTTRTRVREAKGVAARVDAQLRSNPDIDVLVMGDFNARYGSTYTNPVLRPFSRVDSGRGLTELTLRNGPAQPTHDGHQKFPDSKLDYMYASQTLASRVRDTHVVGRLREFPWKKASDHLAVVTEIEEPDIIAKQGAAIAPALQFGRRLNRLA